MSHITDTYFTILFFSYCSTMQVILITVLLLSASAFGCRFACDPNEPLSICVMDPTDSSHQRISNCRLMDANCNRNMLRQPKLVTVNMSNC